MSTRAPALELSRINEATCKARSSPTERSTRPATNCTATSTLIERAGNTGKGSITAVYTVLLDGEIRADPISEESVSLLDGHIVLSRKLAEQGHYPAVDVLASISRIMSNIVDRTHMAAAMRVRDVLSQYRDIELLLRLGEYKKSLDPQMDRVIERHPRAIKLLRQDTRQSQDQATSLRQLMEVAPD